MIRFIAIILLHALLIVPSTQATLKKIELAGTHCSNDYRHTVKCSNNHCIRVIVSEPIPNQTNELVIYLHGDNPVGGASYMSEVASNFPSPNRLNISFIRPGYFDDEGNFSTGSSSGRRDHYTKENIDVIAEAILHLKDHYHAKRVLIVGHSGGAAIASLLLNFYPKLINDVLLINCPCDLKQWRHDWTQSLSPIEHLQMISPRARIHVVSGTNDEIVMPELGKKYVERLVKDHRNAQFYLGLGMKHDLNDPVTREIALKSIQNFLDEATH